MIAAEILQQLHSVTRPHVPVHQDDVDGGFRGIDDLAGVLDRVCNEDLVVRFRGFEVPPERGRKQRVVLDNENPH